MVLLWLTRRPLPCFAVGKGGRQKAQDKAQALTTAPVTGRLLRHLPYTLAALLFSAFYNVADTLFVSHGVGDLAAAGISVVFPLTVLQGAIAQMVGAGAGALVSGRWCRPVWGKRTTGRQAGLQKAPWRSFMPQRWGSPAFACCFARRCCGCSVPRQRSCLMPAPILPFWRRAMCSPPVFHLLCGRRGVWITAFGSGCCLPG